MIEQVAENTGVDSDTVRAVVDEFMLQLHRRFVEYSGGNGDVIGEQLWSELGPQAFYHFLGMLEEFKDRYCWETGSAGEYLMRLGSQSHWLPYLHQMEGWKGRKA